MFCRQTRYFGRGRQFLGEHSITGPVPVFHPTFIHILHLSIKRKGVLALPNLPQIRNVTRPCAELLRYHIAVNSSVTLLNVELNRTLS